MDSNGYTNVVYISINQQARLKQSPILAQILQNEHHFEHKKLQMLSPAIGK